MPTPGQANAAQTGTFPPELLAQMPEQRRGGAIMGGGGGPQCMTQHESVLLMRVHELCDEIRELRRMLTAPSAIILTGTEVVEHFKRLR